MQQPIMSFLPEVWMLQLIMCINQEKVLEVGDTAKITMENMIPPMFKMSAIYNPSGVQFTCKTNGTDYTASFGQYMAGSSFIVRLQDEDAGTYQITDGALSTSAWGTTDGAHRKLTRSSMELLDGEITRILIMERWHIFQKFHLRSAQMMRMKKL